MRALITGATGFLGRHLVHALDAHSFTVCLWRDALFWISSSNAVVYGSFEQVERAIAEYEIDTVFHLAAQTQVSTAVKHPTGTFDDNVKGTWQVLEACRLQKVPRIIIASSDKAYGHSPAPYFESTPLGAHGIYGTSKACADLIAQAYAQEYGMQVSITRCGNLYGPGHQNWSTLIPGTIRSILRNERPVLRSEGTMKRDFLFVEDAVDGYINIAQATHSGIFNLGTGVPVSAMDVVKLILRLMESDLEPFINLVNGPGKGGMEIDEQYLNCDYAQKTLGWKPQHSLEQGLIKTIEWYRKAAIS